MRDDAPSRLNLPTTVFSSIDGIIQTIKRLTEWNDMKISCEMVQPATDRLCAASCHSEFTDSNQRCFATQYFRISFLIKNWIVWSKQSFHVRRGVIVTASLLWWMRTQWRVHCAHIALQLNPAETFSRSGIVFVRIYLWCASRFFIWCPEGIRFTLAMVLVPPLLARLWLGAN